MSKKQKIWMWIFIAMFAIPEILWGSIIKILNLSFLPIYKNIQVFTDKPVIAFFVIIIEIGGLSGILYLLNNGSIRVNSKIKFIINIILSVILLLLLLSLYMSYVVSRIALF